MSEKKEITTIWVDTETVGLDPIDSAPFQISFLVYRGSNLLAERSYDLNPLDDEVFFHDDAYKVHGVSEETIKSYPPAAEIVPRIVDFLKPLCPPEKFVFGGYNAKFDYGQVGGLFFRHGALISDYCNGKLIDVLELVKKAKEMNLIKSTTNNKLTTITEALGIPHDDAHTARSDIVATRRLYEYIYSLWRDKK